MEITSEKPFMINGIKSWIHCLEMTGVPNLEKETPSKYHFHDYIELLYAVNARGYVWCSGKKYALIPGTLLLLIQIPLTRLRLSLSQHISVLNFHRRYCMLTRHHYSSLNICCRF